jgi:hypothetical protein
MNVLNLDLRGVEESYNAHQDNDKKRGFRFGVSLQTLGKTIIFQGF